MWAGLAPMENRPGDPVVNLKGQQRMRAAMARCKGRKFPKVPNPWALTGTEWEGVRLIVEGLSQVEAAERMSMSNKTLQTHICRAKEKMAAGTLVHMAVLFDRWTRDQKEDVEVVLRFTAGRPSVEMRKPQQEVQ